MKKFLYLFFPLSVFAQVGIGTSSPQKDLHVAGSTSTIRIESLDATNNPTRNDGVKLSPVYVTSNGDLTLNPPSNGTSGSGTFTNVPLNFLISLSDTTTPAFIPNGAGGNGVVVNNDLTTTTVIQQVLEVPFTSPQNALIEVKYGVSINLASSNLNVSPAFNFADLSARTYNMYFYIDINGDGLTAAEMTKRYGDKGQAYTSLNQGIVGYPYMNSQGYANIPAGNHKLVFYAEVYDGTNKYTSVGFGGAQDYCKIRIYN